MIEKLGTKALLAASSRRSGTQKKAAPQGFLLGYEKADIAGETGESVLLPLSERRKHVYAIGSTGCGKSNLLVRLIEDEITSHRTCVVMDLRGDLIDRLLLRLASSNFEGAKRIRLIDLREDGFVVPFNPLSGPGDHYTRALHLLDVVRHNSESWGVQLEETLRNALIALSEGGCSLLDIEPLLENSNFRERVLTNCSDEHVTSFFDRYSSLSKDKQQAWSLPVLNKITPLLSIPQLRRMLGSTGGFDWKELLDSPGKIILVALAAHRFHSASHLLGGLLVSSLQCTVMARASVPESKRNPVTLFIDEFETMASSSFGAIIAEGRRFGLSLVLSHQNLSQLDSTLRQAIRGNVATQVFFQTGSSDASDLANDVVSTDSKETVRRALIAQGVGEAFLVRRGQPSKQVATLHSPDPHVDTANVLALKQEILSAGSAPLSDSQKPAAKHRGKVAPTKPAEVRHDKLPKNKQTN